MISDDTLRNLAGERDRLTASPAIDARRVMTDVAQVSEIAADLLRYRTAERADRERIRQAMFEACLGLTDWSTADIIADRAAERLVTAAAIPAPNDQELDHLSRLRCDSAADDYPAACQWIDRMVAAHRRRPT